MHLSDKRGQMFLMAVLIISLWVILIVGAINELGEPEHAKRANEDIEYVLSEIGRESNRRLEYYLSKYSQGEMNSSVIDSDFRDFSRTLEMYAQANLGATVQILTSSALQISENAALPAGISNGDQLFLNISGAIYIQLFGTNSEVQTDLSLAVSVTVEISIQNSRTSLLIFKNAFSFNRPVTDATMSFTGPFSNQKFNSYLNGTFICPADLSGEDLNVVTSDGILLSS
jgi:hypothetical protein